MRFHATALSVQTHTSKESYMCIARMVWNISLGVYRYQICANNRCKLANTPVNFAAWFWQWIQDSVCLCRAGGSWQDHLISSPLYPCLKTTIGKGLPCEQRGNSKLNQAPWIGVTISKSVFGSDACDCTLIRTMPRRWITHLPKGFIVAVPSL